MLNVFQYNCRKGAKLNLVNAERMRGKKVEAMSRHCPLEDLGKTRGKGKLRE